MPRSNLHPFEFVSQSQLTGARETRTFYAKTRQEATSMAIKWGRRRGYKMYQHRRSHREDK